VLINILLVALNQHILAVFKILEKIVNMLNIMFINFFLGLTMINNNPLEIKTLENTS